MISRHKCNSINKLVVVKCYTGDLVGDRSFEYQIMDMQVSRGTVKAVAQLVKEGVLIQVRGREHLSKEDVAYPLGEGLLSFAESLESQKMLPLKLLRHS